MPNNSEIENALSVLVAAGVKRFDVTPRLYAALSLWGLRKVEAVRADLGLPPRGRDAEIAAMAEDELVANGALDTLNYRGASFRLAKEYR